MHLRPKGFARLQNVPQMMHWGPFICVCSICALLCSLILRLFGWGWQSCKGSGTRVGLPILAPRLYTCSARLYRLRFHNASKIGISKLFRYISKRYPLTSQLIQENKIPEFDNLYLDFNSIFHNCLHPNDGDAHFRLSEEQIFTSIFTYVDYLFGKIKPKKLFFITPDGVAPRTKMN